MDWGTVGIIVGIFVSALGTGGLGGLWLSSRKVSSMERRNRAEIQQQDELNKARIEQAKAESLLALEKARVEMINDLQQERRTADQRRVKAEAKLEEAQARVRELEDQVEQWKARCTMLEMILNDHKIPLPY